MLSIAKFKDNIGTITFGLCLLALLVFVNPDMQYVEYIKVFHVYTDVPIAVIVSFVLLLGVLLLVCFQTSAKLDAVMLLLCIGALIPLISVFARSSFEHFWGNEVVILIAISSYFLGRNATKSEVMLRRVVLVFFLLASIGAIFQFVLVGNPLFSGSYLYKHRMTTPLGSSNAIAVKVVACSAFLLCTEKRGAIKLLVVAISFVVVVLTKSRSGIVTIIIIYAIILLFHKKRSGFIRGAVGGVAIVLMVALFAYCFFELSVKTSLFLTSTSTFSSREGLWGYGIDLFLQHPFFGNGFSDEVIMNNPHNWIIQIMMSSGIAGLIVAGCIIYVVSGSLKRCFDDEYVYGSAFFMLSMLVQGLFEIAMFTTATNLLFWYMCGFSLRRSMNDGRTVVV